MATDKIQPNMLAPVQYYGGDADKFNQRIARLCVNATEPKASTWLSVSISDSKDMTNAHTVDTKVHYYGADVDHYNMRYARLCAPGGSSVLPRIASKTNMPLDDGVARTLEEEKKDEMQKAMDRYNQRMSMWCRETGN
mmetsp:Transcript_15628/g.27419  ORF Transcript_15628/g.27419 Transcript_15628/m.27419 type:complete len:138 (+) Transcript_15628:192-605(+)|eukprot:CAMPEP_0184700090 /NCGR_PEP_ID=MMETSP0313-20130426/8347_1 /TAXON_ID=2792 /ORGANISM="Porphyridium aerugineum, Strain SAG 1380-2" /LENGTH=137 /DNA_ID=CAMNT_0027159483 /DNA_START=137 /DNA_END=550 /DNA_ORIENTATION=+